MRGRGGGRGGRGRGRDGDYLKIGPITEEQPPYPPNPKLQPVNTQLDVDQQCLVALNRILINYWKFQSPFQVQEKPEKPPVQSFSDSQRQSAAADPTTQQDLIVKCSGPAYFPEELLRDTYISPARRRGPRIAPPKHAAGESGEKEKSGAHPSGDIFDDDEGGGEEPDDFGGDDYAHDHYADEDREEDETGDDGDVF